MNLLVDAQLPPALAQWIQGNGFKAEHVFDLNSHAASDSAIWEHAKQSNSVSISKDEDFVDRWLLKSEGVALIWIRKGNCSNAALMKWFEPFWPKVLKRLQQVERLIELRS